MVPAEALVPVLLEVPVVWPVAEEPVPEAVAVTELAKVMLKEVEADEVAVPVAVPEFQVETWVKEQERTMSRTSVIPLSYRIVAMVCEGPSYRCQPRRWRRRKPRTPG